MEENTKLQEDLIEERWKYQDTFRSYLEPKKLKTTKDQGVSTLVVIKSGPQTVFDEKLLEAWMKKQTWRIYNLMQKV